MSSGTSRRITVHKTGIFTRPKDAAAAAPRTPPVMDPRVRRLLAPTRMVWSRGVQDGERLLAPPAIVLPRFTQSVLIASGGALVVDFGTEIYGALEVVRATDDTDPVRIRLHLSETLGALVESRFDRGSTAEVVTVPAGRACEFGLNGFRFVRLEPLDNEPLALVSLRAVALDRDQARQGSFRCSDTRVNAVWDCCARTIDLCTQRTMLTKLGFDQHPELVHGTGVWAALLALRGDHAVGRETLDAFRDLCPTGGWIGGDLTATLSWITLLAQWYRHTGNRAWLGEHRDHLLAALTRIVAMNVDRLSAGQWYSFSDQSMRGDEAVAAWWLAVTALNDAVALCRIFGDAEMIALVEARLLVLRQGPSIQPRSKGGMALVVLATRRDPSESVRTPVAVEPPSDMSARVAQLVLEARSHAGDTRGALDLLRSYWGGMLDLGAVTCWEHFDSEWVNRGRYDDWQAAETQQGIHGQADDFACCHAAAAGPLAWLIHQVAGVRPHEAGYRTVKITPHLGDLLWLEATVPTPHGPITVRHERRIDGVIHSNCTLPNGVSRLD